jgi:DNA mismatch endonuclease (patch repair protein)
LPGCPDIVLTKYRTIVFINGCFWHMHEGCKMFVMPASNQEYWAAKLQRNKQRDAENYARLFEMGWKIITVWECELQKNFDKRMQNLLREILSKH